MQYTYLSYFINEDTPLYGGEKNIYIEQTKQISKGESTNEKYLKLPNHTGTHIDFPYHFSDLGKNINNFPPSFWSFNNIFILSYPVKCNEIIDENKLETSNIPFETEFLIIYTGFARFRGQDIYWRNNPGLSPNLAKTIKTRCPNLRVVGFDFISVSSFHNRTLGKKAHTEFLLDNDILLIEDMLLENMKEKKLLSIIALPLLIDKTDGAPITIIATYG